jgi:hypothetical protein
MRKNFGSYDVFIRDARPKVRSGKEIEKYRERIYDICPESGHNSAVEYELPKLGVAGSNPVARSLSF